MKKLSLLVIVLTIVSCAHHHSKPEHHHHAYEKKCAYSVLENNYKIHGKNELKLNHSGVTYYFSSKEKMDNFKKELNENIFKANTSWEGFSSRRGDSIRH